MSDDYSWVGPVLQTAVAMFGEEKASQFSKEQLRLLKEQLDRVGGVQLPNLPEVKPEQLGDSAVGGMHSDENMRSKQLQAIAELQNTIDHGGLDLSDKVSLEEALNTARNQQHRARAGVASDMAQRGQLNSGARMVMDLDAAQAGANDLHRTGMETAALAQRRRLDAIREASGLAGGLREQDWREQEAANRAKDLRDERNSAAREKAGYYNAGLPQQGFTNAMAKATGSQPATNAMAQGLGAAATDARASAAGQAGVIGAYGNVTHNGGADPGAKTYTYDADEEGNRGGAADLSKDDNDK